MLIDHLEPTHLAPAPVFLGTSRRGDTLCNHYSDGYLIARAHGAWRVYQYGTPTREIGNASTYNGARAIISAHIASSHGRA